MPFHSHVSTSFPGNEVGHVCDIQRPKVKDLPTKTAKILMIIVCLYISAIRAVARTLIGGGGGGCIFIYSGSARLTSFEINFISKETSRAQLEYMNIYPPPPINALPTALSAISTYLS